MEVAKVFSPVESIEYADGAVVNKAIIKRPSCNILLFAFDKGEGLKEHTAPHDAVIQVLEGKAQITIGGNSHDLGAGQCIIMPANIPHAVKAIERFKMILTTIKG